MDAAGQIWCDICQLHATPKPETDEEWDELLALEKNKKPFHVWKSIGPDYHPDADPDQDESYCKHCKWWKFERLTTDKTWYQLAEQEEQFDEPGECQPR